MRCLVASLPPSAFSETFLCGSSSSRTRMTPMLVEGARQTTTQVVAQARACLRAACISFAWFDVDIVVLQGSYRRTAYQIIQNFLANSPCLSCLQCCPRAQIAYPSLAKLLESKVHFRKVLRVESRFCESSVPGLLNNFVLIGTAMSELRALCS